jgi:hypothetical protein
MKCPNCGHDKSRTTDTDRAYGGIRRYRTCRNCGHRFVTLERIENWDPVMGNYAPAEGSAPALAVVPDHFVEPTKKVARHVASLDEDCLVNVAAEAQPLLVQWWNESRKSKHKGNATWTEAAWLASVQRVAKLSHHQQIALCEAGVEHGWQALKLDYLDARGSRAKPAPTAAGRPMPKDPSMIAALKQWPSQTA